MIVNTNPKKEWQSNFEICHATLNSSLGPTFASILWKLEDQPPRSDLRSSRIVHMPRSQSLS